jgi:hypothetical protein
MYNIEIGRRLLALYNEDKTPKLSAKEFFDKVMFPDFFSVPSKYQCLMQISNSSFFQSVAKSDLLSGRSDAEIKRDRFYCDVSECAADNSLIKMSVLVGYQSHDLESQYSGQPSNLVARIEEEDIFASWIGAACGISVRGEFSLLINDVAVLSDLFHGWRMYRSFLIDNSLFKGLQIETWNSLWLYHLSKEGRTNISSIFGTIAGADHVSEIKPANPSRKNMIQAGFRFELSGPPEWVQFFLSLSNLYPHLDCTGYVYNLGDKNKTVGFTPIKLEPITHITQIFKRLLGDSYTYSAAQSELRKIFKAHYTLADMVALGGISIRTLRPAKVEAFMKVAKPQKTDDNPLYPILIKSWIIAMLNNDQLADLARDLGLALRDIEVNSRENATTKIEALLNAGSKTAFIVAANELKEHKGVIDAKEPTKKEVLEAAVQILKKAEDAAQRQIPVDQLPLFRALVKSDYLMAKHFSATNPAQLS